MTFGDPRLGSTFVAPDCVRAIEEAQSLGTILTKCRFRWRDWDYELLPCSLWSGISKPAEGQPKLSMMQGRHWFGPELQTVNILTLLSQRQVLHD
jgi:hypothetical protein